MSALQSLKKNTLPFQLYRVTLRDLLLLEIPEQSIFHFNKNEYVEVFPAGRALIREKLSALLQKKIETVYVGPSDYQFIRKNLEYKLIQSSRSLSVGEPLDKGIKKMNLLSLNLVNIYRNPLDDELLSLHFQSSVNLGKFFLENRDELPHFFKNLGEQNHHFTMAQPLLSSIVLLGLLQFLHQFSDRDIETLFLTSYFKDIGLSFIDSSKLDKKNLSFEDKIDFSRHAEHSHKILEGRIPLNSSQLHTIKHHHFLSEKIASLSRGEKIQGRFDQVFGVETTLVAAIDIVIAAISPRPYRAPVRLFEVLELLKKVMADDFPLEYKALVLFLRQFYSKMS